MNQKNNAGLSVSSFTSPSSKRPANLQDSSKNQERKNEIVQSNALPVHMQSVWQKKGKKPSEVVYEQIYKEIYEQTHSRFKEQPDQSARIGSQDFKCWSCQTPITLGFWNIGSNCEYCNYTGRWYCNDCLSEIRVPVPWKAITQFDLKHYKVSKLAQSEIQKLYEVPLLVIEYNSPLATNKTLFEFFSLFEKRMNLCLKQNLFSLKDLYEIYNGSLYKLLEGYYNILNKHVLYCKSCQKKGQTCLICKSYQVVHAYDIRNVTFCEKCDHLYHRSCLEVQNCPSCLVNK